MSRKLDKQAHDAYTKMQKKMPDATPEQREMAVRKYLLNRKMIRVGICFVVALACYFMLEYGAPLFGNLDSDALVWIYRLLKGLQSISLIVGVMIFAKSMHDPLTLSEVQEFEERENLEKTEN